MGEPPPSEPEINIDLLKNQLKMKLTKFKVEPELQIEDTELPVYPESDETQTPQEYTSNQKCPPKPVQTIRTLSYHQLESVPTPMPEIKQEKMDDYSNNQSLSTSVKIQSTPTVSKKILVLPRLTPIKVKPASSIQSAQYQQWKNSQLQGMNVKQVVNPPSIIQPDPYNIPHTSSPLRSNVTSAAHATTLDNVSSSDQINSITQTHLKNITEIENMQRTKESELQTTNINQFSMVHNSEAYSWPPITQAGNNRIFLPRDKITEFFQQNEMVSEGAPVAPVKRRGRGRPPKFEFSRRGAKVKSVLKILRSQQPSHILDRHETPVVQSGDEEHMTGEQFMEDESNYINSTNLIEVEDSQSGVQIITEPDTGQVFTVSDLLLTAHSNKY